MGTCVNSVPWVTDPGINLGIQKVIVLNVFKGKKMERKPVCTGKNFRIQ